MAEKGSATRTWRAGATHRLLAVLLAFLVLPMAAVSAQTPASGFSGISGSNSKKPIDIESDRLEVYDKRHQAIFIGNVSATQGDYNLKSPRLEVTYESAAQSNPADKTAKAATPVKPVTAAAAGAASSDTMSNGKIKFIHALGGIVILTSQKDEQEATGDDAFYDVKAQKVTMTGKKVVLTQKKNIVEGKKLLVDLATGQATVIPDDENGATVVHKGRVRAVLSPEGDKGGSASGAKGSTEPQKATPALGWQVQNR